METWNRKSEADYHAGGAEDMDAKMKITFVEKLLTMLYHASDSLLTYVRAKTAVKHPIFSPPAYYMAEERNRMIVKTLTYVKRC